MKFYRVSYPPTTRMGSFEIIVRAVGPNVARTMADDAYEDAYKHDHPNARQPYWPPHKKVKITPL